MSKDDKFSFIEIKDTASREAVIKILKDIIATSGNNISIDRIKKIWLIKMEELRAPNIHGVNPRFFDKEYDHPYILNQVICMLCREIGIDLQLIIQNIVEPQILAAKIHKK